MAKYYHKIRVQFYEHKTRNSIFWKFLGNHMMEISWKLCAGRFGWMPVAFLMGVIMDQCKNMESDAGYGLISLLGFPLMVATSRHLQCREVL